MNNQKDDARQHAPGIIKVIGIGQSLRGDDAAGLAAVRQWQDSCQAAHGHSNVQVELAELPGLNLLSLLEGAESAVLVDAVSSGAAVGTVHVLSEQQLAAFTQGSTSAHGWGVAETLALGRQVDGTQLPKNLLIIGIEVGQVTPGGVLSPGVRNALPKVIRLIEQFVIRSNRKD